MNFMQRFKSLGVQTSPSLAILFSTSISRSKQLFSALENKDILKISYLMRFARNPCIECESPFDRKNANSFQTTIYLKFKRFAMASRILKLTSSVRALPTAGGLVSKQAVRESPSGKWRNSFFRDLENTWLCNSILSFSDTMNELKVNYWFCGRYWIVLFVIRSVFQVNCVIKPMTQILPERLQKLYISQSLIHIFFLALEIQQRCRLCSRSR